MPITTQCRQLEQEIVRFVGSERYQLETQLLTGRSMRMTMSRVVCSMLICLNLNETVGLVINHPGVDINVRYRNGLTTDQSRYHQRVPFPTSPFLSRLEQPSNSDGKIRWKLATLADLGTGVV